MLESVPKEVIVSIFAEELATKQKKADYWYYIESNREMSSYVLEHIEEIKNLAIKFNILKEVYEKAYKIYDFRDSGKKGFTLQKIIQLTENN